MGDEGDLFHTFQGRHEPFKHGGLHGGGIKLHIGKVLKCEYGLMDKHAKAVQRSVVTFFGFA